MTTDELRLLAKIHCGVGDSPERAKGWDDLLETQIVADEAGDIAATSLITYERKLRLILETAIYTAQH